MLSTFLTNGLLCHTRSRQEGQLLHRFTLLTPRRVEPIQTSLISYRTRERRLTRTLREAPLFVSGSAQPHEKTAEGRWTGWSRKWEGKRVSKRGEEEEEGREVCLSPSLRSRRDVSHAARIP